MIEIKDMINSSEEFEFEDKKLRRTQQSPPNFKIILRIMKCTIR